MEPRRLFDLGSEIEICPKLVSKKGAGKWQRCEWLAEMPERLTHQFKGGLGEEILQINGVFP